MNMGITGAVGVGILVSPFSSSSTDVRNEMSATIKAGSYFSKMAIESHLIFLNMSEISKKNTISAWKFTLAMVKPQIVLGCRKSGGK